jgi:biotin carboxylase
MQRVLLFASKTGYQVHSFAGAAEHLDIELVLATDRCLHLENPWGDDAVPMKVAAEVAARGPFDGIVAVGDQPALAAADAAEQFGLRFHPVAAVAAAKNKLLTRECFRAAGLLTPEFHLDIAPGRYPCVLKPLTLSASRGVIRANNNAEFEAARERIAKLVEKEPDRSILVEEFIPGREFALEGLVTAGHLHVLAIFDKPDPLDGPYFEETIYVTPSRETAEVQQSIAATTQQAVAALGLRDGPVHCEMRVNSRGVWMLEVAARPIGGLCSRALRFEGGRPLEEILLRHALGEDVSRLHPEPGGHAVMMIPIPRGGIFVDAHGVDEARAVAGIEDVMITAKTGQELLPLPEGASYLGFIFARSATAAQTEAALRQAHARLSFEFATVLPVVK